MSISKDLHTAGDFICFDRINGLDYSADTITCDNGDRIELFACGEGVVRLRLLKGEVTDYGILSDDLVFDETATSYNEATSILACTSGETMVKIEQNPLRISLYRANKCILQSITDEHFRGWSRLPAVGRDADRYTASFALESDERVYGLGEKFGKLNKRGQLVHSYVEDALGVNTDLSYKNTPFAWSPSGWGLFTHTPSTVSHGVGYAQWSHRSYTIVVDEPVLDLFFITGDEPADVIKSYINLTGSIPEVPLWSYGVWVSRAYYKNADEILDAAKTLRDRDFPADVITFDGRAWQDTSNRFEFKFDPKRYDNPGKVIRQLHDYGLRVCAWEYPLVSVNNEAFDTLASRGYFLKTKDGGPYLYDWDVDEKTSPFGAVLTPLPVSGIVDFTNPEAYAWWRDQHNRMFELGVDVMKVDFGEQVPMDAVAFNGDSGQRLHSVYPMLYNKCVYEATRNFYGDDACVWSRTGWAGSHRYPLQWGGDPQSDWEGMASSLRGGLCWGMSAAPFHATDVGGFYGKSQPSPELYLRWVQWSIFSSHFRIHGIGEREPWCFGEHAETIARQWFKLRYRLIPYLAGVGHVAAKTGLPVMRAMPLAFPSNRIASTFEQQFMCGDALLVAAVISNENRAEVWLPEGRWHNIWTGEAFDGNQLVRFENIPMDQIPLFLRDGHALPLGRVVSHTDDISAHAPINSVIAFGDITNTPTVMGGNLSLENGMVKDRNGSEILIEDRLVLA